MPMDVPANCCPQEGLRILARIIARAYLADTQAEDTAVAKPRRKVKKDENIRGARRNSTNGKGSY